MKKVILIAKPDTWYQEGTEVFDYDGERFTLDRWNSLKGTSGLLCRGIRNGEWDGELCDESEFCVTVIDN